MSDRNNKRDLDDVRDGVADTTTDDEIVVVPGGLGGTEAAGGVGGIAGVTRGAFAPDAEDVDQEDIREQAIENDEEASAGSNERIVR